MPTIVREDHNNLNTTLTLTIPVTDYGPKLQGELNKHRKQATMKGFRKGKTPLTLIKKMYGKRLLVEIVNKIVGEEIDSYLKQADFEIIGQPIPSEEQEHYGFDVNDLEDFVFKFDLGLAPEFEVQGLESTTFNRYVPLILDSILEKDLVAAQKKFGKQEQVSTDHEIQENDILKLQSDELEGEEIKENGWTNEFSISFQELSDEAKLIFEGKKKGDLVQFDIFNLSPEKDEQFVRKYFLDVNEDAEQNPVIGNNFKGLITNVTRVQPGLAELNQEFFDKYFGLDIVKSEEEARGKIKAKYKKFYELQADTLLFNEIRNTLEEKNSLEVPVKFLKRWIEVNGNLPEGVSPNDAIDNFVKSLNWSLIRGKLIKRFNITVEESEIKQSLRAQIVAYLGGQDLGNQLDELVENLMKDKEQYNNAYSRILTDKLLKAMKEIIIISENEVSPEEFDKIIKEENAKNQTSSEPDVEITDSNEDIEEAEVVIEE